MPTIPKAPAAAVEPPPVHYPESSIWQNGAEHGKSHRDGRGIVAIRHLENVLSAAVRLRPSNLILTRSNPINRSESVRICAEKPELIDLLCVVIFFVATVERLCRLKQIYSLKTITAMSTQTKNAKSGSTKEYFAQRAQRMYSAETDVQTAAPIESGEQSVSPAPAETSEHILSKGGGETMDTTTAASIRAGGVIKSSIDAPVPAGDVDVQTMREIIGAPIETNEVSMHTSHKAPYLNSDAPNSATTSNVEVGAAEPNTPTPSDRNDKTGARPSIAESTETGVGTVSTASSAHTGGSEPSVQTEHTAPATPAISTLSTEPSETTVPTPQTATIESSANSGDALNSNDTTPAVQTLDTDPVRRTLKQRKGDLDEYKRRFMSIPKIEDRKPVFVSCTTRDRLDRIVRLLGERGMSVSGLVENIALRHLETHEADIELWRKM